MATIINGTSGNDSKTAPAVSSNPDEKLEYTINGLAGNDTLTGSNGEDDINGGAGNDTLEGKGGLFDDLSGDDGNDTYVVNLGTNLEYIDNYAFDGASTTDTVKLGAGITEADLFVTRWDNGFGGGDLVIKIKNTNDVIWIENYFTSFMAISKLDQIVFANGTTWTQATMESKVAYTTVGSDLTDILVGTTAGEALSGLGGIDFIKGGAGNDTLTGGAGFYDELQGDSGSDTYIFNLGDGRDGISNYSPDSATTTDILKFGAGITQGNITITQGVDDEDGTKDSSLRIAINGTTDRVDFYGYFDGAQIDKIVFNDGSFLTQAQIDALVGRPVAEGTTGVDYLDAYYSYGTDVFGYAGDDTLTGYNGNDKLDGGTGNDELEGGAGTDTLIGGAGNDTYVISNAADVINETSTIAGEIDTALSTVSYTLGATLENLVLDDGSAINGTGNTLNNVITGNSANNILNGGVGADTMVGGQGNDTYIVDNQNDDLGFFGDVGIDQVNASVSFSLASFYEVEKLVLTGTAAINATGSFYANTLTGNSGANVLDGMEGVDSLIGGGGNDTYIVDMAGEVVTETSTLASEIDTVKAAVSFTLSANLEKLILTDFNDINGVGNNLANTLTGNDGNNLLNGGAGADTLIGGMGADTYIVDQAGDIITETTADTFSVDVVNAAVAYTLSANIEKLVLTGTAAINGIGNGLANNITGNSGANLLNGGGGIDTLVGGAGSDTYIIDNVGDVINESSTLASDVELVQASASFTLSANLEQLVLIGTSAISGTGNALANTITGNSAGNTLNGGAGADTLIGGGGNDIYVIDNAGDVIAETSTSATELDTVQTSISYTLGANLERLVLTGSTAINATGNALANILTGNSAGNRLSGGTGVDTLIGGGGNDTYVVDNVLDVVTETTVLATEIDIVQASASFSLSANLDKLVLTGTLAINGTGNALANTLTGNSAANLLNGGAGIDTLIGGAGSDTYIIDNVSDVINEASTVVAEIDVVQSSVSFSLSANLEKLVLTGSTAINGTGNALANTLTGNGAGNVLNGGTGVDTLIGGGGNDTYIIDSAADVVTEVLDAGTDIVQAGISVTLSANLEKLVLTGTAAINGTGNDLANTLTGNSAANVLKGGTGTDTLIGGGGNDTYVVDNVTDVINEASTVATEMDVVQASVSFTLSANLEKLVLTGTAAINGTGNALANTVTGNSAANVLSGGSGVDTLIGGAGSDTYIIDNVGDVINEASTVATEMDVVQASVSFTLSANLEMLILTGTAAISGTGNALANTITGSNVANILNGSGGADTLIGGLGSDSYIFGRGYAADTVVETSTVPGNSDVVSFNTGVATSQLWFSHVGNNLEVSIIGTADKVVVKDWYSGNVNHVEQFKTTDGSKILLDSKVENLVSAMSTMTPPPLGQTNLTAEQHAQLDAVIAANWS